MSNAPAAPVSRGARRLIFGIAIGGPMALILAYAGLVALAISLADQNFEVRRGSVQYYALMGGTIRNAPLIEPVGEPRFEFRGGDGPKPTETIVSYVSKADAPRIEAELGRYLEARGYARRKNENPPPAEEFADGKVSFEIVTQPLPDKTIRVFVTKYEF
jgi:hypothetical protein